MLFFPDRWVETLAMMTGGQRHLDIKEEKDLHQKARLVGFVNKPAVISLSKERVAVFG